MKQFHNSSINSPIGQLQLITHDNCIISLLFENDNISDELKRLEKHFGTIKVENARNNDLPLLVQNQLDEYFFKERKIFDVPIKLIGSSFDLKIWRQLQKIEYGQTISYIDLANAIGCKSARAVGSAVGRNPIGIILPCHRVINKNGKLGGYRGGLEIKKELLKIEKIL